MMLGWAWADAVNSLIAEGRDLEPVALRLDRPPIGAHGRPVPCLHTPHCALARQVVLGVTVPHIWQSFAITCGFTVAMIAARHQLELAASQVVDTIAERHEQLYDEAPPLSPSRAQKSWTRRYYMGKVQDRISRLRSRMRV